MDSKMSRREFLKYVGLTTGVAMFPEQAFAQNAPAEKSQAEKDAAKTIYEAGDHRGRGIPPLEQMLKPDVYRQMAKDLQWDKVYGPEVDANAYYGGRADYDGHRRNPGHDPGTDYPVPLGFPLVPITDVYLNAEWERSSYPGGIRIGMFLLGARDKMWLEYAHLTSKIVKYPGNMSTTQAWRKLMTPRDVIARSGDTGRTLHPHVHVGIGYVNDWNVVDWRPIDFEKVNKNIVPINEGKPFFWDGNTFLTHEWFMGPSRPERQYALLEKFIRSDLQKSIQTWEPTKETAELAGKVLEYKRLIGNDMPAKLIMESKHFHGIRDSLAQKVLVEKLYSPASGPYSANLAAHSYGRNPEDGVMVCLPFLSPDIIEKARVANWDGGIKKLKRAPDFELGDKKVTYGKNANDQVFWGALGRELGINE